MSYDLQGNLLSVNYLYDFSVLRSPLFLHYFTACEYFHQKGEGRELKCNPLTIVKKVMKLRSEYHGVGEFCYFVWGFFGFFFFLITDLPLTPLVFHPFTVFGAEMNGSSAMII